MFRILEKTMLTPSVCRMVVEAPRVAKAAKPGQFLMVRTGKDGERIPLTISDYDASKGTVTIVTQRVGASSAAIVALEAGMEFTDVAGPLGNPSEFCLADIPAQAKTADASAQANTADTPAQAETADAPAQANTAGERFIFIAGGVGAAPVYPQVKWLRAHGRSVDVIVGARTKDLLIYKNELETVADHLYVCTDDGSEGFHGVGTALLEKLVAEGASYTRAVAIGPMIMMKFSTLTCQKLGIPVTVSLNTLMVDGTGMCGGCRVSVGGKMKFACVDGPEFDGALVDFDEAMRRQAQYKTEEAQRYAK